MKSHCDPFMDSPQPLTYPHKDRAFPYSWDMARGSTDEERKSASRTASVFGRNLTQLMAAHAELCSNPKLSKKTGLGTGTISRLKNGAVDATLSTVEAIAKAFDVQPWQLLVDGFDPKTLPTLQPLTERERQLYERWRDLARDTLRESN